MRRMFLPLVSMAALALAGCNGSHSSEQDAANAPAAVTVDTVTGTVSLRDPGQAVSADAKLVLSLVDVSSSSGANAAPLATKTVAPASFPQDFTLKFNPADVNPADLYVVKAQLTDGERHYEMALQTPVLTKGASNQVAIQMVAKQTPAEKQLAEFDTARKQIGGMKITNGSKLEKDVSRAWQVFRANGAVQFIRSEADYGDKGFTSTDYAYKDGAPWVVVQQKKESKNAKPESTRRAGWDKDGNLVLAQVEAGGKTEPLGDQDAADLKDQAQAMLKLATNGKGK